MLSKVKTYLPLGGRTFKTGISVFITTLICQYFHFPAIFAVMTAIVTVEHTAADSIKKAMVRFPASAIGAFLSVSFYSVFGKSAITYALAAMLTIALCHKLKLDEGIVVATLTAIAMIPDFHGNSFDSFIVRLATTTIGIVVSTLVNFFLLPPNYTKYIDSNMENLFERSAKLCTYVNDYLIEAKFNQQQKFKLLYREILREINQTSNFIQFQREEWKYHKFSKENLRRLHYCEKKLTYLKQVIDHMGNLQFIRLKRNAFSEAEKQLIRSIFLSFAGILKTPHHEIPIEHYQWIEKLDDEFWHWKEEHVMNKEQHLPPQTIVLYELLFLHRVIEELHHITHIELSNEDTITKQL
ncbi:FUSC family protein [Salinibacillus xinjiangensis]|uniref:Aromatic acid exporter family protein n=1 Tax=Salinibacillus xinjiangensis TaxID=1229268 RepID=A0A6G1X3R8_9BACI|nr:aromatic acid exporter family protein [Salinibacillus xinjiangensis]MRG85555.1 aromatic acid exporter family protein [Salinibacillus xinjiangensis]